MIYITGDTHIPIDIHKLNKKNFPMQKTMTSDDYVIICGDFGGVWDNSREEHYWRKWLGERNFTTLFVDGNHENFPMLYQRFKEEDFCGGKVHRVSGKIYHLMRGQVFTIDGYKFFTMGGASSHDKEYRREGFSWWREELPSDEEYDEAMKNLKAHDWEVDYVISHCAADSIQDMIFGSYEYDMLTNFFEKVIKQDVKYKHWYFGHYHMDWNVDERHSCVYNRILSL